MTRKADRLAAEQAALDVADIKPEVFDKTILLLVSGLNPKTIAATVTVHWDDLSDLDTAAPEGIAVPAVYKHKDIAVTGISESANIHGHPFRIAGGIRHSDPCLGLQKFRDISCRGILDIFLINH